MTRVRAASVAEWADACSNAFVPLKVRTGGPRFAATLDQIPLTAEVSITRVASGGSDVYRSSRVIAEHPRDDVLLSFHRSGRGSVLQHDRRADLTPGHAVLYDASSPYTLHFPGRMSETVLQIPRRAVHRAGHAFDDLTARVLPPSNSLNALMNLVQAMDSDLAAAQSPMENELLAEAAVTLLQSAILTDGRPPATRIEPDALAATMYAYIDQHLSDPELTVDRLAAAHHVSIRLVHKIFAAQDSSPGAYIRRKRLALAHARLLVGDSVMSAALRAGFTDPDTFTRAFKRQYRCPPSTLRPSRPAE